MENVSFLNLEYIILYVYSFITGIKYDALPEGTMQVITAVSGAGILISLGLLSFVVYLFMRIEHLEHVAHERGAAIAAAAQQSKRITNKRWEHVLTLISSSQASDWRQAILESDIMLAELLNELGVPGTTIGDQLKAIDRRSFNTLDLAWEAHLVRNNIAHEGSGFDLSEREAHRTIDMYRRVFDEFAFI